MLNKLERKIGKYAIPHLINYLLIGYAIGYVLRITAQFGGPNILQYLTLEPYYIIHEFQFWRLITWLLAPPVSSSSVFGGIFFMLIINKKK